MISRKTTVSAAALLIASAGAASAFPATATTDLNVRSGPGTGYGVVDQLQEGETVDVMARSGGWYQLGNGGWASGSYLDAEGATVGYAEPGYGYGPVAFYYDESPYYYDNAGFYFYIRDGRRHRIGNDWWHNRRDGIRWSSNKHRHDFERRFGDRDGRDRRDGDNDRRMSRGDSENRGGGDNVRRGERDGDSRRGDNARNEERSLRSGRSSSIESGAGGDVGRSGQSRGGEVSGPARGNRGGGDGGGRRIEGNIPGGGY